MHIQRHDVSVWYLCRGVVGCDILLCHLDQDMVHQPNVFCRHCVHKRVHANDPGADIHLSKKIELNNYNYHYISHSATLSSQPSCHSFIFIILKRSG